MIQGKRMEKKMGLLGSVLKLAAVESGVKAKRNTQNAGTALEQGSAIRFRASHDSDFNDRAVEYRGLPVTYFDIPQEGKEYKVFCDMLGKIMAKNDLKQVLCGCDSYFVIMEGLGTKITNGLLACEKGVICVGAWTTFTPVEKIVAFDLDKNWLYAKRDNGIDDFFPVMSSKKIKEAAPLFLKLFREVYQKGN